MKCKNCAHFNKSNNVELSQELTEQIGTCSLDGAITKSKEKCKNGSFERK